MEPCDHVGFHSGRGSYDQLTEQLPLRHRLRCVRSRGARAGAPRVSPALCAAGDSPPPRRLAPMETGVAMFPTHDAIDPGSLAALVEERGHGALYFPEHTHIPASRETRLPGRRRAPAPLRAHLRPVCRHDRGRGRRRRSLRVGSGICLIIERDPIVTAKEVASIDHLSGGRVDFGVGAGWNREEMANHGTDPTRRFGAHARARRGDEGDLDPGGGELPRRAGQLRAHLVVAQARSAPAPAGDDRRQRRRR